MSSNLERHVSPLLELEALERAVRWPSPAPQTIVALVAQLLGAHRDGEGYAYFQERAAAAPDQPLFLALEGVFQARLAREVPLLKRPGWIRDALAKLDRAVDRAPGLTTYFRGVVQAELPSMFRRAEAAVADLEWVLAHKERFPVVIRRGVYRGLARAYAALGRQEASADALHRSGFSSLHADGPAFLTDYWITADDGFHFTTPRLAELAPGVHVAQGYDFGDFAFVSTTDGVVVVDAGTTEAHARAALQDFRAVSDLPISHAILTHAHWDHIGGLAGLRGPDTEVIAQANFAQELEVVNGTALPFRAFLAGQDKPAYAISPDRLIDQPTTITVGGVEIGLYPVTGGETTDGLLVHLPSLGIVFTGDVFMPYLGAPFLPEGSLDGLLDAIRRIRALNPTLLIHGHTPLTANFTVEALPGLEAALRELRRFVLDGVREGRTLAELLHANCLPDVLRDHPAAVNPYLIARNNVVQRLYHQRTGYWKPDGEGVEVFAHEEWASALDLLGGGKERSFARAAERLAKRGDLALAFRLVELGLRRYPHSSDLATLRRRTLDGLRERNQQLNPFKFIVYSEWAGAELRPVAL